MKAVTRFATAAVAAFAFASTAEAQIQFSTQGFFTSAAGAVGSAGVCTGSGTLATMNFCSSNTGGIYFMGSTQNTGPANTQFGQLQTFGTFNPEGTRLTIRITQTGPSGGSADISGLFTGAFAPGSGFPSFLPTPTTFSIGGVSYTVNVDNTGRINIDAPPAGTTFAGPAGTGPTQTIPASGGNPAIPGNASDPKSITGTVNVSTVPEPSTYVLMAAGLAGLGLVARRRRTA